MKICMLSADAGSSGETDRDMAGEARSRSRWRWSWSWRYSIYGDVKEVVASAGREEAIVVV
jgi:hypothetical protein